MDPVFEFRHNSEVRTSASDSPEEIRVSFFRGIEDPAVGEDNSCRKKIIDDEAMLASEKAGASS